MKALRIILALLVVIGAGAGSFLTAQLMSVRNSYTRKNIQFKKEYGPAWAKLVDSRRTLDDTKLKAQLATLDWGRWWENCPTQLGQDSVTIDIGSSQGVVDNQWLHGFELTPEGKSVYRGEFKVTAAREGQSVLKPTFRVRTSDGRDWKAGNWRWRQRAPGGMIDRFGDMEVQFLRVDEMLVDRRRQVTHQEKMIEEADAQKQLREAEIVGGDLLPKSESLPLEYRAGYLAATEEVAAARDAVLLEIDGLRRKVRVVAAEIQSLQRENIQLVKRLPAPATEAASR